MKVSSVIKSCIVFYLAIILLAPLVVPINTKGLTGEYTLPPPLSVNMSFETTMFRRMSIREFTEDSVTDEELSTILWAAYGKREDGTLTVPAINGSYAAVLYVLKEDAAYTYDPENHSLIYYKEGDWRDIVGHQYHAPIQLGLCWNTDIADKASGATQLGAIGQNIQFMANALNVGTVVTGEFPPAIEPLGLPENEEGMIVMPLGYPKYTYTFEYKPRVLSLLPAIQESVFTLSTVLELRNETETFQGELTLQEETQLLWSCYGYSYYLDRSENAIGRLDRHRTVPSAHGYYPLTFYFIKETGIYRYFPNIYNPIYGFTKLLRNRWNLPIISFNLKIGNEDVRDEIATAAANPALSSSPLIILATLDDRKANRWDDLSGEFSRHLWLYEAGASAQNCLLEATAFGLQGNIVFPQNVETISSLLRLGRQCYPLLLIPLST